MTEGVSAMHQTSMAWRHLHRKDDISPMAKTQGKKQLGKESNSNSQNWKRKCENKDWNHGIDTAYSGYRDGGVPERKVHTQFPRWTNTSFPPFIALLPSWSRGFCTVIRPPCDSRVEELDLWVLWRHRDCGIPRCNASGWWWAEVLQIESPVFCVPLLHRW